MTPRTQLLSAIGTATALILAAVVIVRQDILNHLEQQTAAQQKALDSLNNKMTRTEARLATLEAAPSTDPSAVDALRGDLETVKQSIASHESKLNTLQEKPPAPAPAAPAVAAPAAATQTPEKTALLAAIESGGSYAAELAVWDKTRAPKAAPLPALHQNAPTGIATDPALRVQFRDILKTLEQPSPAADEPKLVQRLNTHLSGLVSIRKTGSQPAPEYAALRDLDANATLETMAARVDALPGTAQSPFLLWREAVRARLAVQAELATLGTGN